LGSDAAPVIFFTVATGICAKLSGEFKAGRVGFFMNEQ
jgi:hypothetical protein